MATVDGSLCRSCAAILALELESSTPAADLIGAVDRVIAQRIRDPIVTFLDGIATAFGASRAAQPSSPSPRRPPPGSQRQAPRPNPPPRPQPPPPRPEPPPDPRLLARMVMGFEPNEPLTKAKISDRKQKLARVFHPDMPGGSEAQMKRINHAADLLMAKL